jgi:secreted trypsin-like serine protease
VFEEVYFTPSLLWRDTKREVNRCNATTGLIVGGQKTNAGEFPHMAAIGEKNGENIKIFCGGSLISDRFVVHCYKP